MNRIRMSKEIACIENIFLENAQYRLGLREQKVILYLVANTDPFADNFTEHIIPIKELEAILKNDGKKWGGIYQEMENFCADVSTKQITFPSGLSINDRELKGYINWFQSVRPVENKNGELCIRFLFSTDLKPFLLRLREYAKINRMEVANMRSSYSIRLFQICKALREKLRKHKTVATTTFEVNELKKMLGLYDAKKDKYKYAKFSDFKKKVLSVAEREINELTSIFIEIHTIRNSKRQITDIRFNVYDNDNKSDSLATKKRKKLYRTIIGKNNDYTSVNLLLFKKEFPKTFLEFKIKIEADIRALEKNGTTLPNKETMLNDHVASLALEFTREKLKNIA